ncbi:pyridine nucleotide-disulfide oxidoreductase-domain-containing protein [Hyaloraphidium curvatum]|nr:pyridine nucleotide-disulfide oxidoreductase-domain-containing protein [Hyaloraphidium curvatum]
MAASPLSCDYLVIGAGALGIAFCDSLLSSSDTATVILADRNDRPGGHWTVAYPYVALHQAAFSYGVAGTMLGSGTEVEAHLKRAVHDMEGSGRLRFLACTEWRPAERALRNVATGDTVPVRYAKLVMANYNTTTTSAMRPAPWKLAPGVVCTASRGLPSLVASADKPFDKFCVLGGGKTGMDTVTWLLGIGVAPDRITWVIPRPWYGINRKAYQVTVNSEMNLALTAASGAAMANASSLQEAVDGFGECGYFTKLAAAPKPDLHKGHYHHPIMSLRELELLDSIEDLEIGRGHVVSIDAAGFDFDGGARKEMPPNTCYVDCAAETVKAMPAVPVWQGDTIVVPFVVAGMPCLNAALIAKVDSGPWTEAEKNAMLRPIEFPDRPVDHFYILHAQTQNLRKILAVPELAEWIINCRLGPLQAAVPLGSVPTAAVPVVAGGVREAMAKSIEHIERLMAIEAEGGDERAADYLKQRGETGAAKL